MYVLQLSRVAWPVVIERINAFPAALEVYLQRRLAFVVR